MRITKVLLSVLATLCALAVFTACSKQEEAAPPAQVEQAAPAPATPVTEQAQSAVESAAGAVEKAEETATAAVGAAAEGAAQVAQKAAEGVQAAGEKAVEVAQEAAAKASETASGAVQAVAGAAKAVTGAAIPETVVIKNKNGDVTLTHKAHNEAMDCKTCHGEQTPGKLSLGKEAAHTLCKGCHQDGGAGPTKCGDCHKK